MNLTAKIDQNSKSEIIGRIGGNIPCYFLEKTEIINGYKFYAIIQNPDNSKEFISIFVPENYDLMVDNNIYPNCAVKVFTHSFSEESDDTRYTINHINKTLITGYSDGQSDEFDFVTKSEHPKLIQDEDYYSDNLKKDNYSFLLQIDEDYYPENLIDGNYIFGYGALYLYRHNVTGEVIAGFWQYS